MRVRSFEATWAVAALLSTVVLFGALPGQVFAQGSAPVTIVGPLPVPVSGTVNLPGPLSVTGTVATKDVDIAARSPFQATVCSSAAFGSANPGSCSGVGFSFQVPSNRRLVIEQVTGDCSIAGEIGFLRLSLGTTAGGTGGNHVLRLQRDPLDARFMDIVQLTRMYADPGTPVGLGSSSGSAGANPGGYRCFVTVVGHTVAL